MHLSLVVPVSIWLFATRQPHKINKRLTIIIFFATHLLSFSLLYGFSCSHSPSFYSVDNIFTPPFLFEANFQQHCQFHCLFKLVFSNGGKNWNILPIWLLCFPSHNQILMAEVRARPHIRTKNTISSAFISTSNKWANI